MLAELIAQRQPCVVLTGAGVSTESGIPDFRSATGIWAQYDPLEVASIEAFRRDPAKVWDFYAKRLDVLGRAEPNAAHHALAALEEKGLVDAIVTQNVDGLHQRAGSKDVVEVHGSIRSATCPSCARTLAADELELPLPRCPSCGAIVKPAVVMFGELLPVAALERATELARGAALLLVVGSSLEVWPVAGLPQETVMHSGELAIVNRDPTPYDGQAVLVARDSAGEVLGAVSRLLV